MSEPWSLAALVVATLSLAGTACSDDGDGDADCSLENVIGQLEPAGVVDCGTVALSAPDTEFESARSCIANAIDAENPFRAVWGRQGIDSEVRQGYLGVWDAGSLTVTLFNFDGDPAGGGGAQSTAVGDECADFAETATCTTLREDLCYGCGAGTRTSECP